MVCRKPVILAVSLCAILGGCEGLDWPVWTEGDAEIEGDAEPAPDGEESEPGPEDDELPDLEEADEGAAEEEAEPEPEEEPYIADDPCGDTRGLPAGAPWPLARRCPTRIGRSEVHGPTGPNLYWTFDTEDPWLQFPTSPVIDAAGTVYFGADDVLFAVDAGGQEVWRFDTGEPLDLNSPALGPDGLLFVAAQRVKKLYALRTADGSERWSIELKAAHDASPVVDAQGRAILGGCQRWSMHGSASRCDEAVVVAVAADGNLSWRYPAGGAEDWMLATPALAHDGGVLLGSLARRLLALRGDGTWRWTYAAGDGLVTAPAIDVDGTLYFGSQDKRLYALSPDGAYRWDYETLGVVASSPAIAQDGTVIFGSQDWRLYAVDRGGRKRWDVITGGAVNSSPVIDGVGTVYVGSNDRRIYAVLAEDGTVDWYYDTAGTVSSSPAIGADGTLYVVSTDGKLYALHD